ncbi:Transient receptor putative cation channel sub A member 1 [Desmophyllum pertusum]|uniref:Transient receptor putative cation channel sub A member 1 n=1 Tax=Desmophyllum pertusum TaxID=174260 RepID=A0A9W9YIQ6_9CNID|nr:Transient receptor putative cation channel sub A member 1 [Desmophyllum pertusum]
MTRISLSWETYITVFNSFSIIRELLQLYQLRLKYFLDAANYMDWAINLSALFYVLPPAGCPCKSPHQMEAAAVCLFLGWLNLVLYLRRLSTYGRFVVMLMTMFQTLLKVLILFILFILAFGVSFYILMGNITSYSTLPRSLMKTFIMTLGELNFEASFVTQEDIGYSVLSYGIFILFALVMPIILMNMLIGLAVGDIDNIQKNAVMDRYRVQVELLLALEESLPKWLLRRLKVKEHTEYPNHKKSIWTKMWMIFCDLGRAHGDGFDQSDQVSVTLSQLKDRVDEQDIRSKEMERILNEQLEVLNELNRRLRGNEEGTGRRIMNWFGLQ